MSAAQVLIRDARVFDGDQVLERNSVLLDGERIAAVGLALEAPPGAEVVDATGQTVLPGLFDAHAHPTGDALALALPFGVTTELDMFNTPERMGDLREQARTRNDVADLRSASTGATVLGGHPSMLIGLSFREQFPVVTSEADAAAFVQARVDEGADFIKLLIDDGTAMGHPSPTLTEQMAAAVVEAAHAHGLLAVAHAISLDNAAAAVRAGADGLNHVFMDQPPTDAIVEQIAAAGIFVIPTLSTMASLSGTVTGDGVAHDPRSAGLIPDDWRSNLCQCWHVGSPSSLENAKLAVAALHRAGVRILAGSDVADVGVFGTAHGASLHSELALLVDCGLTPVDALRGATSLAADAFRLPDRGRLRPGLQGDLVLVAGDPTRTIGDSLSISGVWRRGERLARVPAAR